MIAAAFINSMQAQNYLIATRNGDGYDLNISKKAFADIFDAEVAPYIGSGKSTEKFIFEDLSIDDPSPSDNGSVAYLQLKASSSKESVTIGITLLKDIATEQMTRLYLPSLTSNGEAVAGGDAGWKCTSRPECGGCRKVRENGAVVACPCYSGESYCSFEVTGGGGTNWPSWLTSLLNALLRFF